MKPLLKTILSRELHDPKVAIYDWLKKYNIKNYTLNDRGEIDVDGDVKLCYRNITEIPPFIRFGVVKGDFYCYNNNLTSLEGAPKKVGGVFACHDNELTSLKGSPREVKGDFTCYYNQLTSLEGAPEVVGGSFYCYSSNLTSPEGAPKEVGRDFDCNDNDLTTLKGAPKEVGGGFYCSHNKTQFTKDDVRKICKVGKHIYV